MLIRALTAHAATAGIALIVDAVETRGWSSATFIGARHRVTLTGPALASWAGALTPASLPLPRRWIGELDVRAITADRAVLDVLVLDDDPPPSGHA